MGAWDRSWGLTKMSFGVMKQDSEMIWFPILAGIFSALYSIALIVPSIVLNVFQSLGVSDSLVGPLQAIVLFVTYFGLAVIATFFNVCVVYTTSVRLGGGDATFMDSIKFAMSRLHLIIGWAVVSASVGLLLHALDRAAERMGLIGKILMGILRAMLASAWAVTTVFVVPAMVYRGLGPIDAIKESTATLRRTWGESLIQYYGMGFASFVCALPGLLLFILGIVLMSAVTPLLGLPFIALGFLWFLAVTVLFNTANMVYRTALYAYASGQTQGQAPRGYDLSVLQGAFGMRT